MSRLLNWFRDQPEQWKSGFWFGGAVWLTAAVLVIWLAVNLSEWL